MHGLFRKFRGILDCLVATLMWLVPGISVGGDPGVETALSVAPDLPGRLVLAYWPAQGWIVRQDGRRVELALPGAALDIALPKLPADRAERVAELSVERGPDATYLRLALGCDCTIAVQGDGHRLAIDVVGADLAAGPILAEAGPAPRLAPRPAGRPAAGGPVASAIPRSRTPGAVDSARLEETRDRLMGQLRRAAEQGLVTLRPAAAPGGGLPPEAGGAATPQIAVAARPDDPVQAAPELPSPPAAAPPLQDPPRLPAPAAPAMQMPPGPGAARTASSAEVPAGSLGAGAGLADQKPVDQPRDVAKVASAPDCLPSDAFLLPDPVGPERLARRIAELRQSLIGEFDRPVPEAVAELARLYIAHRMGAEAGTLIDDLGAGVPDRRLLVTLARLVEDRPLPQPSILSAADCGGQHALWQALDAALAGRNRQALQYEAAAVGALEQMSRGLRGHVAARIGLAAAAEEDRMATHRLLAMARRSTPADLPDPAELLLLAAEDDRLRGDTAGRAMKLDRLRNDRSLAGAKALVSLAELEIEAGTAGDGSDVVALDGLLRDLGALSLARRGAALGEAAALAEVRLTARSRGRDLALEVLELAQNGGMMTEATYLAALTEMATMQASPDQVELALIYEADPQRFSVLMTDRAFRHALARSYARLGAPALAWTVLRSDGLERGATGDDIARVALVLGDVGLARQIAGSLPAGPERTGVEEAVSAATARATTRDVADWAAEWDAAMAALREAGADAGLPPGAVTQPAAARLAFAALQAGRTKLPAELQSYLENDPEILTAVRAMFLRLATGEDPPVPAEVPGFSQRLTEETRLLEALLDDG